MDGFKQGRILSFPLLKKRRAGKKVKYTLNNFTVLPMQDAGSTRSRYGRVLCLEWYHIDCVIEPVPTAALDNSNVDWF